MKRIIKQMERNRADLVENRKMADRQRQLEEERREKAKELASLKLELEKQAQQMAEFEKRIAHRKARPKRAEKNRKSWPV